MYVGRMTLKSVPMTEKSFLSNIKKKSRFPFALCMNGLQKINNSYVALIDPIWRKNNTKFGFGLMNTIDDVSRKKNLKQQQLVN